MAPFTDPQVAAVRCIASSDTQQMAEWYTPREVHYSSLAAQHTAEAGTGWLREYPSATCCTIWRAVWEQFPYDERHLEFMHDKFWASQVLGHGFKISRSAATYVHVRHMRYLENWRRENRAYRDLYRARGYVPLRWSQCLVRMGRAALLTPLVALRYFTQNVLTAVGLATIPCQATLPPRVRPPDYYRSHARARR